MVYIAQYNENQKVIGFKKDDTFYPLSYQKELELLGTIEYKSQTTIAADLETKRITDIAAKATEIIETRYSTLKQRKLSSIAISLLDKKIDSMITDDEEALLQSCREVNTWISSIRTIENIAISKGVLLDDIDWS